MIDPVHTAAWLAAGRAIADLVRYAGALMPKGSNRESLVRKLDDAERAHERSDARLAFDLGYPLCRCSFPPKPMLWDRQRAAFVCREPGCEREERAG
jgi:hypothetical protein